MQYFLDTEFYESGPENPIVFISIGIVTASWEYEAVSNEFDEDSLSPWLKENVVPKLPSRASGKWKSRAKIAKDIKALTNHDGEPLFIASCGAYDWVVLCQLFGKMIDLPGNFNYFFLDIKQRWLTMGKPELPKDDPKFEHNALYDAQQDKIRWEYMDTLELTWHNAKEMDKK